MCIFKLETLNLLNGYTAAHRYIDIVTMSCTLFRLCNLYSVAINCIMNQHLTS